MNTLDRKILDRSAVIGILGMGYVGLPLAVEFLKKGFKVVGFDVESGRVRSLNRGRSHIPDVPSAEVAKAVKARRFRSTSKFDSLAKCDAVVVCVPTPLRKTKEPDLTFVIAACEAVAARLRKGQLIILESTTYPGTTRELVLPLFEARGLEAGKDFHLAFSPERVDPANKTFGIANTPKVVGGLTPGCLEAARLFYSAIVDRVVPVSSLDGAEMVKLLENTFRAVNIALVNEMALMCDKLGVDIWEIIEAASTKPFGFMPFYPGPGLGGHCIPVDPSYLAWKMRSLNFEPRFIELAATLNSRMPEYAVRRIGNLLNGVRKPVKGSRIFVLGVAYKPGVNDVRESPALDVIAMLREQGAIVEFHDPFVSSVNFGTGTISSKPLTTARLKSSDLTVILTAHKEIDYRAVLRSAPIVFDARNATAGLSGSNLNKL